MSVQVGDTIRRECHQCGVTSYPHSSCRCRVCGLRHAHVSGCRQVPVLCAQCGSRTAPHKACLCCRCGKIHTIRAGCRPLSAVIMRRLPIDSKRDVLMSRVNCHHCGTYTNALPLIAVAVAVIAAATIVPLRLAAITTTATLRLLLLCQRVPSVWRCRTPMHVACAVNAVVFTRWDVIACTPEL